MRRVQKSIDIKAPVADVFTFMNAPQNFLAVWPSMIEVSHITNTADGGHDFDWVYKMAGMRFHGRSETVKVEKNAYLEARNAAGIPSTFQWKFEGRDGGTRLTVLIEYEIPAPVIGRLAEAVVERINEHEIETLLTNVRLTLEAMARGEVAREQRPRV